MFKEHPKGLYILFFTEMWERFSYYGMRAILTLYMITEVSQKNPGLGWDDAFALSIYGWYTMAVYVMSIPGGIIADRWLGQKKTVLYGGILLVFGHSILAIDAIWAFAAGLTLIVLGVGGLKPNISTMVGGLYREGDPRRDKGFTIFYIGINIGAWLAALIVGGVGEIYGWHYGFGLAGIGMTLGLAQYLYGQKYLKDVGEPPAKKNETKEAIHKPLTKIEKDRMVVLFLSFIVIIAFWAAFEQAGGLMNIYTNEKVNRMFLGWQIPTSWFQSLNPLFIIIFGTLVAGFWYKRQTLGKEASTIFKMAIGIMIMGTGFLMMSGAALQAESAGQAGMYWIIAAYLLHTIGELCASPTALSFITKLAPVKYGSLMMGSYFAATGLGNKVAGMLGGSAEQAGELQVFTGIFIFTAIFGITLLVFLKKLKALTHGAEDIIEDESEIVPEAVKA
ncbi:MAG: peptide MFS transporter [Candidatus Marinimicrobia bacterium]|nr:peptide MFS transporter [Candidatus Neomarinimicrobiota bacterium]